MSMKNMTRGGSPCWFAVALALAMWSPAAQAEIQVDTVVWPGPLGRPVDFVHLNAAGTVLLAGSAGPDVRMFERDDGRWKLVATVTDGIEQVTGAAWAEAAGLVVVSGEDGTLVGWDPITKTERYRIGLEAGDGSPLPLQEWEVSPDGRYIGTVTDPGTFTLWDAHTGHMASDPHENSHKYSSILFSPSGDRVAIQHGYGPSSRDASLTVFETETLEPFGWMPGARRAVAFDETGQSLVSSHATYEWHVDSTTTIWHVETAALLYLGDEDRSALGARTMAARFTPDDRAEASRIAWSMAAAEAALPLPSICTHGSMAVETAFLLTAVVDHGVVRFCDVGDASNTEVDMGAAVKAFAVARNGGIAAVGLEDGRLAIFHLGRPTP